MGSGQIRDAINMLGFHLSCQVISSASIFVLSNGLIVIRDFWTCLSYCTNTCSFFHCWVPFLQDLEDFCVTSLRPLWILWLRSCEWRRGTGAMLKLACSPTAHRRAAQISCAGYLESHHFPSLVKYVSVSTILCHSELLKEVSTFWGAGGRWRWRGGRIVGGNNWERAVGRM